MSRPSTAVWGLAAARRGSQEGSASARCVAVFGFARRHPRLITQIAGVMLIAVGILEV